MFTPPDSHSGALALSTPLPPKCRSAHRTARSRVGDLPPRRSTCGYRAAATRPRSAAPRQTLLRIASYLHVKHVVNYCKQNYYGGGQKIMALLGLL